MHIAIENVQKTFNISGTVAVKALKGVSLEIRSGSTIALVGASGAGKSTLLHIVGLMDSPTAGTVSFDGQNCSHVPEAERARLRKEKIGFIFQLHYLLPEFTVMENIAIAAWEKKDTLRKNTDMLIGRLGLEQRKNHLPSELSGGEQQRVALARALIKEPRLLLADEPTGNLDRETGEKVENLIFEQCKERNITLVLVTHNSDLAKKADRIIHMRDGLLLS